MLDMQKMQIMRSDNAKSSHNDIYASQTMPYMQTMSIVQKNAISYISLDDCRFGIVWAHNWHCVGAQLAQLTH